MKSLDLVLNKSLAQSIVTRTTKIIPYSLNVMNEQGIIIASNNPKRINQKHVGAILALRNNTVVEVDEELAKQWNYEAHPGINLPIKYLEQSIGVIGISGELASVRPYAELVKMAAELIIEQNVQLENSRWDKRYKEEFILNLLKGKIEKDDVLKASDYFSFDPEQSYVAIIIKSINANIGQQQELVGYLQNIQRHPYVAVIDLDKVVILKSLQSQSELNDDKKLFYQILPSHFSVKNYKIVVGSYARNAEEISFSYQTALYTLSYAQRHFPKKSFYSFRRYTFPALLEDLLQNWHTHTLKNYLTSLKKQDEKQLLRRTLKQYFLSNCDLAHTSAALYIHINTLRYRLHKIEQITGLSFNKIDEKFILYLGIMFDKDL